MNVTPAPCSTSAKLSQNLVAAIRVTKCISRRRIKRRVIALKWTDKDTERLFRSGIYDRRGMDSEYADLAKFLNAGWITIETEEYVRPRVPEADHPHVFWYRNIMRSGGKSESPEHRALKWAAWEWLRNQGEPLPTAEYSVLIERMGTKLHADVAGRQLRYIAECGDTQPSKVVDYLMNGWEAVVLFPFNQQTLCIFRLSPEGSRHFMM